MVQCLHCLLLIHIIGTSLCLAIGVVWGLRCVDLRCCLGCKAKQVKIVVLQYIKPSVGARGWRVNCTGYMGFGLHVDSCSADRHLWRRNKQREKGMDGAGQASQNWPDEKSLVFEEGTSKGHKAWTVQACQNWPDEKSLVLEATHFVFRLAGLLTFLFLCSDNSVTNRGYLLPLPLSCVCVCARSLGVLTPCSVGRFFTRAICNPLTGVCTTLAVMLNSFSSHRGP